MTGQNGQVARISPGKFRQLGPVNWLVAKLAARAVGAPQMHPTFQMETDREKCSAPANRRCYRLPMN